MKKLLFTGLAGCSLALNVNAAWIHDWSAGIGSSATSSPDRGKCVAMPINNAVTSAGVFTGTVDFDPSAGVTTKTSIGTTDMYILQDNINGTFSWVLQVGGSGCTIEPANIITDANGTLYVCGRIMGSADFDPGAGVTTVTSASSTAYDAFLASYSASGSLNWAFCIGGTNGDEAYGLCMGPGGTNVAFTGFYSGSVDFDPTGGIATLTNYGGTDGFLARYNASTGAYNAAFHIGGSGDDAIMALCVDGSSNLYATGYYSGTAYMDFGGTTTLTSAGGKDIFVCKYSGTTLTWDKSSGGTNDDQSVDIAFYGNYVYIGGGVGAGTDNFAGGTYSMTVGTGNDGYLAACDLTTGNTSWLAPLSPPTGATTDGNDMVQNIAVDGHGYVYATGLFGSSTLDIYDPSTASVATTLTNAASGGSADFFMLRYNTGGVYKDACRIGASLIEGCPGLVAWQNPGTGAHEIFVTGAFMSTVDFDPGAGTVNHSSGGLLDQNIFIGRYSWTTPVRLHAAEEQGTTINLFPNPSAGTVTVDHLVAGDVVTLYSLDGKEAASWPAEDDRLSLDLSTFENGVYLLNIRKADGTVVSEKIILQR